MNGGYYYLANLEIWACITVFKESQRSLNRITALCFLFFLKNATKINSPVSFYFLKWFKWPVIYSFLFPCGLEHSWHSLMFLPPKEAPWKGRGSKAQAFLPLPAMLLIISLFYHGLNHKIMASPGVTMSVGCRKIKDIDAELSEQT